MKTILANVDGFTPVIDSVVAEVGLMSAVVFGRMWRFTQMKDGVCNASLTTIAEYIGVDKATVQRHADKLCEAGFLKDLTPDLKNQPHTYVDTGKAGLNVSIGGVAQRNAEDAGVAENNAGVAQRNAGVAESRLKKVYKKEKESAVLSEKDYEDANAMVDAIIGGLGKPRYQYRDQFPEVLVHYADLYVSLTGQSPRKKTLSDWLMTFHEWNSLALKEHHIRQAYQQIIQWSEVTRPDRLTETADAIRGREKVQSGLPHQRPAPAPLPPKTPLPPRRSV